jgi:hypothetical protein
MRAVAPSVLATVLAALTLAADAQPAPAESGASPAPTEGGTTAPPAAPAAPATPAAPAAPAAPATPAPPATPAAPAAPAAQLGRHRGPWLLVGGSIALVTAGAVLAYSANAAERDVEDLYVGLNGTPPPFNDTTRKLYDDAIAEGRRYQTLSIVSFGLAGAMAAGAAVWFAVDKDERVTVAPAVAPGAAGVSTTIRF